MENYIDYKRELEGLENVLSTVKTIEKIAASRVHTVKEAVQHLAAYSVEIEKILGYLGDGAIGKEHALFEGNPKGGKMLVIFSGNRGLVGSLWHDLINISIEKIREYRFVVTVGKKAESYIREEHTHIEPTALHIEDLPSDKNIGDVAEYMIGEFKKGHLAGIDIAYPRFVSLSTHEATIIPFLPFRFAIGGEIRNGMAEGLPIIEPSKRRILSELMEKYINAYARKIVLETSLSELSSRTVTMEHATEKTRDIVKKMKRTHAKDRVRMTTQKQIESFTAHKFR